MDIFITAPSPKPIAISFKPRRSLAPIEFAYANNPFPESTYTGRTYGEIEAPQPAYVFGGASTFQPGQAFDDKKHNEKEDDEDFPFLPNVTVCRTYGRRPSVASLRNMAAEEADSIASLIELDSEAAGYVDLPLSLSDCSFVLFQFYSSLAVVACGPGQLIDDCRKACVSLLSSELLHSLSYKSGTDSVCST